LGRFLLSTREAPFVIENDDATDTGEQGQIFAGREIAAGIKGRATLIRLSRYIFKKGEGCNIHVRS
jgi:hypothetical protein